jgi:large subunit ribosomal protein L10
MPTPQKTEIINDLTQKFQSSSGIYFTRYSGMNVAKITDLRRKFRENEVSYFVSKNTLTKIAAQNAGYEDKLNNLLNGQIGIAYVSGDPTAPARVIHNFEKGNKDATLEVIGLVFEGEIFSAEKYKEIANLPSRDELLAIFVSTINQPMSKLVGTLNGSMSKLMGVLSSLKESKS